MPSVSPGQPPAISAGPPPPIQIALSLSPLSSLSPLMDDRVTRSSAIARRARRELSVFASRSILVGS